MTAHLKLLAYFSLWAVAASAQAQFTEVVPKSSGPARVLVLGATADDHLSAFLTRTLEVQQLSSKARDFQGLHADGQVMKRLRGGGWDFVVLSDHPTFGKTLLIEGEPRVGDPSGFLHHGRLLVEEIRRSGARAVLLVPPGRPGAPPVDRQAIEWAYTRLGREAGAKLAPVGDAFAQVRRRRPDLALFDPYGEGWSEAGAYLAASVLEATLTGRPPAAAGPAPPGSDDAGGLSAEERGLLDDAAWQAVQELAADGGYRDVAAPPFPAVPTIPRGNTLRFEELRGTWRGPLRLYPWPASLELQVSGEAGQPRLTARVEFEGDQEPVRFGATEVSLEPRSVSFRNRSDLAGGRTLYRLVAIGDRLQGVAELVTEDGRIYAIGSLELARVQRRSVSRQP